MVALHEIEGALNDKIQSRASHIAASGCQHTHDHAGYGGMHAGFMEGNPYKKHENQVDGYVLGPDPHQKINDQNTYTAEEECSKACPAEVGVGEACRTTCAESSDSCRKACPGGGDEPTEENPIPESP